MKLFIILCLLSTTAWSITADELREISGRADREQREKANRLDINDLDSFLPSLKGKHLLPAEIEKSSVEKPKPIKDAKPVPEIKVDKTVAPLNKDNPQSLKYKKPTVVEKIEAELKVKKSHKKTPAQKSMIISNPDEYIPPPRNTTGASASGTSDFVVLKQRRYGIPLGTWFKAKLNRSTTNSDPGLIELIVTGDVEGQHKSLPSGTYLFSEKQFNSGTQRLDLHIIRARLPDGDEIELDCLVYDASQVAGLQGIIVENNSNAVASGFKHGLINAGQALVDQGTSGTVTGTILSSTTDSLAGTQQASIEAQTKIPFTVHVSPQAVFVQVQSTF